jgi:flagellar biosynthesis protein FlhG
MTSVVAIGSGKGGVGKTWLAASLAHALARLGRRVLLFDGDLGLANVDVQLGLAPGPDLASVLSGRCTLTQAVRRFEPGGFDLIAGRSGCAQLALVSPQAVAALVAGLRALAPGYDRVLLDLPAGIDALVRRLLAAADSCLVLTTDEPTAITDAYALIKVSRTEIAGFAPQLVVNQVASHGIGRQTYEGLRRVCEHFLGLRPELAGIACGRTLACRRRSASRRHFCCAARTAPPPATSKRWRATSLALDEHPAAVAAGARRRRSGQGPRRPGGADCPAWRSGRRDRWCGRLETGHGRALLQGAPSLRPGAGLILELQHAEPAAARAGRLLAVGQQRLEPPLPVRLQSASSIQPAATVRTAATLAVSLRALGPDNSPTTGHSPRAWPSRCRSPARSRRSAARPGVRTQAKPAPAAASCPARAARPMSYCRPIPLVHR